jgi:hypothetical protein
MFIGEFLCIIPLLLLSRKRTTRQVQPQASVFTRILARMPLGTGPTAGYEAVEEGDTDEDGHVDEDEDEVLGLDDALTGWRVCWMWFPAFCDSRSFGARRR